MLCSIIIPLKNAPPNPDLTIHVLQHSFSCTFWLIAPRTSNSWLCHWNNLQCWIKTIQTKRRLPGWTVAFFPIDLLMTGKFLLIETFFQFCQHYPWVRHPDRIPFPTPFLTGTCVIQRVWPWFCDSLTQRIYIIFHLEVWNILFNVIVRWSQDRSSWKRY